MENMINYEEELKKFRPSLDVNEAEDAIYNRDFHGCDGHFEGIDQRRKEEK